jgi:diguanylate cyclase (GGDEF)-like protein
MRLHSGTIAILYALGFIAAATVGHLIFNQMKTRIHEQHVQQFTIDSNARLNSLNNSLELFADRFKSFADLPSFRSMRFHLLTRNNNDYKENVRHLELYAYEMHQHEHEIRGIRFINKEGIEVFKVENNSIIQNLSDISQDATIKSALLLARNTKLVTHNNKSNTLTWWLPVHTSNTVHLGVLAFEVDLAPLESAILMLNQPGRTHSRLIGPNGNDIMKPTIDTRHLTRDPRWTIDSPLNLPGLQWTAKIYAVPEAILYDINSLENTVTFVITPLSAILILLFGTLSIKKIRSDKKIHHMAYFDSLTGLINRNQFEERLTQALQQSQQTDAQHALFYMDLDQFKVINDTCGHLAGDRLLEQVSRLLKQKVRESDVLARMGGDEFTLLLENCPEEHAHLLANEILHAVANYRFTWDNKSFGIGISIGITIIDSKTPEYEAALSQADMACHMAKEMGRNRTHTFSMDDQRLAKRHGEMQWVSRLKHALDNNSFFLECQQILPLQDQGSFSKAWEIFVRIQEDGKVIYPDAFIPSAERYGLMPRIDRWVINETFSHIARLKKTATFDADNSRFFINLSALTLSDQDIYSYLQERFNKYHISPTSICFEVTETAAIADLNQAIDFMTKVHALGCSLALDDFGSGLCSFSYLRMLPVDYIKIDGVYVEEMLDDPMNNTIVEVINKIGKSASLQTIAEFASSEAIVERLIEIGIDFAQGYAIQRPHPLADLDPLCLTQLSRADMESTVPHTPETASIV